MTNLQAIDVLNGLEQSLDDYCELNDEGKTAFRMAIAALELFGNAEQLPSVQPETHEERTETHACDLISRQAAITAIQKAYADTEGGEDKHAVWKNIGLTAALHIMQDLPSAQPERKTGQWIGREHCQVDEDGYDIGTCSVCGEEITIDPLHDNFCPHCGAEMSHDD